MTYVGERKRIIVKQVRYGIRSFARGNGFILPIDARKEDCLILGNNVWNLTYPCRSGDSALADENILMLSSSNDLIIKDVLPLEISRAVLVTLDGAGEFSIVGRPDVQVHLDIEADWKTEKWLLNALMNIRQRKRIFSALGGSLPFIVTGKEERNEDGRIIVVSLSYPTPFFSRKENDLAYFTLLGYYVDDHGRARLLMRSGSFLCSPAVAIVFPSLPEQSVEEAIVELAQRGFGFWMFRTLEGWKQGVSEGEPDAVEIDIRVLEALPKQKGIICCDVSTLVLKWLPMDKTSRAGTGDASIISDILTVYGVIQVKQLGSGVVSLLDTLRLDSQFRSLYIGQKNLSVIPRLCVRSSPGRYEYICERFVYRDIWLLISEVEQDCESTVPIPVEVVGKTNSLVTVVPVEEVRTELKLSNWVIMSHAESLISGSLNTFNVPERFDTYNELADMNCLADAETLQILSNALVYYYHHALDSKKREKRQIDENTVKNVLVRWLNTYARILATGGDKSRNKDIEMVNDLDLIPTICGILLLRAFRPSGNEPGRERFNCCLLHLIRMVGLFASASIHQEAILKCWLLLENRTVTGLSQRLEKCQLSDFDEVDSAELDPTLGFLKQEKAKILLGVCNSIIERGKKNSDLLITAYCMKYAIGESIDYSAFTKLLDRHAPVCLKLSTIARSLSPGYSLHTAINQPKFLENTVEYHCNGQNWVLSNQLLGKSRIPISLLLIDEAPLSVDDKDWADTLINTVIGILKNDA
jgi:hypothetical protein